MSTYKKNNADIDIGGFSNCPEFLERYLNYRQTFTNMKSGSVVDIFTVLREFCQYIHYKRKILSEPSTKDAHKDMDICMMPLQEICDLSQEDLERYLCFLETKVRNSAKTICKKLNFIKKFYLYLERNAQELDITLPHGNPARFLELPQTAVANPVILTQREIEKLLNGTTGENALRDTAMIMVLVTTGIQTTELINLDRGDIRDDLLLIRSDKSARTVILTDPCADALKKYLHSTSEYADPGDPIFLGSATGKRLTARTVQMRIEKAAGIAGLGDKGISARTLRNTAASMLFRTCGQEGQHNVRKYLGCRSNASMRNLLQNAVGIDPSTVSRSQIGQIGSGKKAKL